MNKIGILGAMPCEVEQLFALLSQKEQHKAGGVDFYEGKLSEKDIVLCCAGMGKVNAAAATQLLITVFGCDAIVLSGIAGNMTNKISVGDVVIGDSLMYHDAENRMIAEAYPHMQAFTSDARLVAAAEKACQRAKVKYIVAPIATGDLFIGDTAIKNSIAERFAPACVEMEGAAVAHIAAKNDVPFGVVRTMSDDADEDAAEKLVGNPFDIGEYVKTTTAICAAICELV
ncbi:MAG: 5'-methylthioadenosine/adenosylhomocysteine nucleosidase [Oscillospiraceae bacterium]